MLIRQLSMLKASEANVFIPAEFFSTKNSICTWSQAVFTYTDTREVCLLCVGRDMTHALDRISKIWSSSVTDGKIDITHRSW